MVYETTADAIPPASESAEASRIARIRELNDQLRTCRDPIAALVMDGQLVVTRGIAALGNEFINHAVAAVRDFDAFTEDNDPWGEHDCATLTVDGKDVIFKIDYYDPSMEHHTDDAADPKVTRRVLTIMLAEDW